MLVASEVEGGEFVVSDDQFLRSCKTWFRQSDDPSLGATPP